MPSTIRPRCRRRSLGSYPIPAARRPSFGGFVSASPRAVTTPEHVAVSRPLVVEGIESGSVCDILPGMSCNEVQESHIARPMPAQALPTWLANFQPLPACNRRARQLACTSAQASTPRRTWFGMEMARLLAMISLVGSVRSKRSSPATGGLDPTFHWRATNKDMRGGGACSGCRPGAKKDAPLPGRLGVDMRFAGEARTTRPG